MNMSAGLFSVNQMFSGPTDLTQGGTDCLGDCFAWEMDGLPGSADRPEIKGEKNPPRPDHHYWNGDDRRREGTATRVYPGTRAKFDRYARMAREASKVAGRFDVTDGDINWMPRKMPMPVVLDENGRFSYVDHFESLVGRDGHGGALLVRHADIQGVMDLVYDGYAGDAVFQVRGAKGRDVVVTLTYQLVSENLFSDVSALVHGFRRPDLKGDLGLEVSLDGHHWLAGTPFRRDLREGVDDVEVRVDSSTHPQLRSERYYQCFVRITMKCTARHRSDFAAWMRTVRIDVRQPD